MPICEAFYSSKQEAVWRKASVCSMSAGLNTAGDVFVVSRCFGQQDWVHCGKTEGAKNTCTFPNEPFSLWAKTMLWVVFQQCKCQNIYYSSPEIDFWFSKPSRYLNQTIMKHLSLAEMLTNDRNGFALFSHIYTVYRWINTIYIEIFLFQLCHHKIKLNTF